MFSLKHHEFRGRIVQRALARGARELKALLTTVVLATCRPHTGQAAVVTLNPDEENATVQVVKLGNSEEFSTIVFVTPSPQISREALVLAARRLNQPVPPQVQYRPLSFSALLQSYAQSVETYSTHVLLPGKALTKKRKHVHLTHGSGPKPDTTFTSPITVLASITPQWVSHQLKEYGLPAATEVVKYMPRLEIMKSASGDSAVLRRLGIAAGVPLIVWAPTYRVIRRGNEIRTSGLPLQVTTQNIPLEINKIVESMGGVLVLKVHPHDFETYEDSKIRVFTNQSLRDLGTTPYELFGVASLVITDYSSIAYEREVTGLASQIVQPDLEEFKASYRGLRKD